MHEKVPRIDYMVLGMVTGTLEKFKGLESNSGASVQNITRKRIPTMALWLKIDRYLCYNTRVVGRQLPMIAVMGVRRMLRLHTLQSHLN
jgi:hypothetical protein